MNQSVRRVVVVVAEVGEGEPTREDVGVSSKAGSLVEIDNGGLVDEEEAVEEVVEEG